MKQHVVKTCEVNPLIDKDIIQRFEEEYLAKILGFCYQKVNTREEAEDLSSEITLEVLKTIYSGKKIENLSAFVWSVSNHTFFKWLRSKRYGTTAYLDDIFPSSDNIEEYYIHCETEKILHREIAMLSENYREVIVLYYFEGKGCSEIANLLGKNINTVKWWLHSARKSIKEGLDIMREYGEKSYNPDTLLLSCQGNPGINNEPISLTERKLPQNILLAAYHTPFTIEQLCTEIGVPTVYMEDEVKTLLENQLIKEVSSGKYQTDFVILPNNMEISHKIYDTCFPDYYNVLIDFLEKHKTLLESSKFNTAGFTWDRLLWVYIHIVTDIVLSEFKHKVCKTVMYQDIPNRPNGGKWIALGYHKCLFSNQNSKDSNWKEYIPFDGPVHKVNKEFAQGYFHYWSGLDSNVFFDIPDGVFALCGEIIKNNIAIKDLSEDQKYLFSIALQKKLFIKDGDIFRQNYFFVEQNSKKMIEKLAYELYPQVKEYFEKAYGLILDQYRADIPEHLHWQMGNFLSNYLNSFVTCSLYEGMERNILSVPDDTNKEWLSLFASE